MLAVGPLMEVVGGGHRVEVHGIQVRHHDSMPLPFERFDGQIEHGRVERLWLMVRVDNQYVHNSSLGQ
ncbi:hypothetical protein D3C80_2111200 [compost metagenome]